MLKASTLVNTTNMRVAAPAIALAIAQTSVAASVPQLQSRQSTECKDVHVFLGKVRFPNSIEVVGPRVGCSMGTKTLKN